MTDAETIEAARRLFASDTPGDKLGRGLLAIAEREHTENQELRNLLSPLRDAVLYARAQRRPLGMCAAIRQSTDKHDAAARCADRSPGRKPRMWALLTEIDDGNPPKLREVASFGFWAAVVVLLSVAVARC